MLWSDGKLIYPMFPKPPQITKCNVCFHPFWLDDVEFIGEADIRGFKRWLMKFRCRHLDSAQHVTELTEDELLNFAESGNMLSRDREIQLRLFAWWAANDSFRMTAPNEQFSSLCQRSPRQNDNLRHLV